MGQTLLKNGTTLVHGEGDHITAVNTDILIEGNKIVKISPNLSLPEAVIIDCMDKIISPGFVDTHHHVWQTQLKGRHADDTLLNYFPKGNFTAKLFKADDVFWGQLGGCLEMINGGTTTVADYAHINMSPEHNYRAISATVATGMRSVYGFSPNPRLSSTEPFIIDPNGLGGHSMSTFEELGKSTPWGDGRVQLGLAYDGWLFTPQEYLDILMSKVRELGIKVIQTHVTLNPGTTSIPAKLAELGYLDKRFLMAHSGMSEEDAALYKKHGVHYSSTPSTDQQMALAFPVVAFNDALQVKDLGSLGCDAHSICSAFIPSEARIGLQGARAARNKAAATKGKTPLTVGYSVEDAFNLATIGGARAMNMEDNIGSIAEGKMADLVIWDANSPSMVCAGVQDPVAAIIIHSSPADIDAVIIDGVLRKQYGRLTDLQLDGDGETLAGMKKLSWPHIAHNLMKTRKRIQEAVELIDMEAAEQQVMKVFHMSPDVLTDSW